MYRASYAHPNPPDQSKKPRAGWGGSCPDSPTPFEFIIPGVVCPRCAKENDQEDRYCSRCGLEFAKVAKDEPRPAGEVMHCFWHPKEETNLSCGRCDRPICTRCVINGPAGIRCKECGKMKIKLSARGLAHDTSRPIMHTLGALARQPYLIFILILMFGGVARGCMSCRPEPEPQYEEYEPPSEPAKIDQRAQSTPNRISSSMSTPETDPPIKA